MGRSSSARAQVEPEAVLRALLEGDPQAVVAAIGAGVVARGKATAIGRSDQHRRLPDRSHDRNG